MALTAFANERATFIFSRRVPSSVCFMTGNAFTR